MEYIIYRSYKKTHHFITDISYTNTIRYLLQWMEYIMYYSYKKTHRYITDISYINNLRYLLQ